MHRWVVVTAALLIVTVGVFVGVSPGWAAPGPGPASKTGGSAVGGRAEAHEGAGTAYGGTEGADGGRQIVYEFEIVQLQEEESVRVGLTEAQGAIGAGAGLPWRVLTGPGALELAGALALGMEAGEETVTARRAASPWIVTTLGHTGLLRVVQEEKRLLSGARALLSLAEAVALRVTPLRVDEATGRVWTAVEVAAGSGPSHVSTELAVHGAESQLVAFLEQQVDRAQRDVFGAAEERTYRYYAVYITGRLVDEAPSQPLVGSGRVSDLSELFWPAAKPATARTASVAVDVSLHGPPYAVDMGWTDWFDGVRRFRLTTAHGAGHSHVALALEQAVRTDEQARLFFGVHVLHEAEVGSSAGFVAFSLSEERRLGAHLTARAGYAPLVYGLRDNGWASGFWWAALEVGQDAPLRLSYRFDRQPAWHATWQLPVGEATAIRIGYRTAAFRDPGTYTVGVRWAFAR